MTYSNGSFNPNPFANPFNTRLGPSNWCLNPAGDSYRPNAFRRDPNAKLPDPAPLQQSQELHVPDTTPPMSFRQMQSLIDQYSRDKTWNDNNTYSDMLPNSLGINQGLSRNDIEYWNKANIESAKLSANMSDERKKMLSDLSASGFFDSKLIEESKNGKEQAKTIAG